MLLTVTFRELLYCHRTVDDIPAIEVVEDSEEQQWWAVCGNRRLYLYKMLQELGIVTTVPVVVRSGGRGRYLFNKRHTTKKYGRSIHIRNSEDRCIVKLDNIVEEWKQYQQQLYQQKLDQQTLDQQKLDQQKLDQQKLDKQKLDQQKLDQQKLDQQKLEQQQQKLEQQQQDKIIQHHKYRDRQKLPASVQTCRPVDVRYNPEATRNVSVHSSERLQDPVFQEVRTKCDTHACGNKTKARTKCSIVLSWLAGSTAAIAGSTACAAIVFYILMRTNHAEVAFYTLMRKKHAEVLKFFNFMKLLRYLRYFFSISTMPNI